jgi:hypothetical protein
MIWDRLKKTGPWAEEHLPRILFIPCVAVAMVVLVIFIGACWAVMTPNRWDKFWNERDASNPGSSNG